MIDVPSRLKWEDKQNSRAVSPPSKTLPSLQIKTILHQAASEVPETPVTQLEPEPLATQEIATPPTVNSWDQFCLNIEETIDEYERRIKVEEARYSKIVANRELYEHYMDPAECRQFFRDSALRLVNFDPNFDCAEVADLPHPWELHRSSPTNNRTLPIPANSFREAPSSTPEFAYPQLPRGRY